MIEIRISLKTKHTHKSESLVFFSIDLEYLSIFETYNFQNAWLKNMTDAFNCDSPKYICNTIFSV